MGRKSEARDSSPAGLPWRPLRCRSLPATWGTEKGWETPTRGLSRQPLATPFLLSSTHCRQHHGKKTHPFPLRGIHSLEGGTTRENRGVAPPLLQIRPCCPVTCCRTAGGSLPFASRPPPPPPRRSRTRWRIRNRSPGPRGWWATWSVD